MKGKIGSTYRFRIIMRQKLGCGDSLATRICIKCLPGVFASAASKKVKYKSATMPRTAVMVSSAAKLAFACITIVSQPPLGINPSIMD